MDITYYKLRTTQSFNLNRILNLKIGMIKLIGLTSVPKTAKKLLIIFKNEIFIYECPRLY